LSWLVKIIIQWIPEYGLTAQDKFSIGQGISSDLWHKIRNDLNNSKTDTEEIGESAKSHSNWTMHSRPSLSLSHVCTDGESQIRLDESDARDVKSPSRRVRTRLYFTSESLLHTMLSVIRHSSSTIFADCQARLSAVSGLGYLTQIIFKMYENTSLPVDHPKRFVLTVFFSEGVHGVPNFDSSMSPAGEAVMEPLDSDQALDSDAVDDPDTDLSGTDTVTTQDVGPDTEDSKLQNDPILRAARVPKPLRPLQINIPLDSFFEFVAQLKDTPLS